MEVSTCKHSGYSTRDIVYKEITSQQFALANSRSALDGASLILKHLINIYEYICKGLFTILNSTK